MTEDEMAASPTQRDTNLSKLWEMVKDRDAAVHGGCQEDIATEQRDLKSVKQIDIQ